MRSWDGRSKGGAADKPVIESLDVEGLGAPRGIQACLLPSKSITAEAAHQDHLKSGMAYLESAANSTTWRRDEDGRVANNHHLHVNHIPAASNKHIQPLTFIFGGGKKFFGNKMKFSCFFTSWQISGHQVVAFSSSRSLACLWAKHEMLRLVPMMQWGGSLRFPLRAHSR